MLLPQGFVKKLKIDLPFGEQKYLDPNFDDDQRNSRCELNKKHNKMQGTMHVLGNYTPVETWVDRSFLYRQ